MSGLKEYGAWELTECADTQTQGLVIWLGTSRKARAVKLAQQVMQALGVVGVAAGVIQSIRRSL